MSETNKLCHQLTKHFKSIYFGGNWAASNLKDQLHDIDVNMANTKLGNTNTIAMLTFHINYYIEGVLQLLNGGTLDIHDKFSFEAPEISTESEWRELVDSLLKNGEAFSAALEKMAEEQLWETFVDPKYGNYCGNIMGLIEHNHYHLGQIVILKKLIKSKSL